MGVWPASAAETDIIKATQASKQGSFIGLYRYTMQTNHVKETTSQVDIGYHYVAVDANGKPIDTDGDGLADYLDLHF